MALQGGVERCDLKGWAGAGPRIRKCKGFKVNGVQETRQRGSQQTRGRVGDDKG